jgi:hypothetical protein
MAARWQFKKVQLDRNSTLEEYLKTDEILKNINGGKIKTMQCKGPFVFTDFQLEDMKNVLQKNFNNYKMKLPSEILASRGPPSQHALQIAHYAQDDVEDDDGGCVIL